MIPKPRFLTAFLYALIVTGLSFVISDKGDLVALAIPPLVYSTLRSRLRIIWLLLAFTIGLIGVFINALFFANTGNIVIDTGFLVIRERAIEGFTIVSLRLLAIMSAGSLIVLCYDMVEVYGGLAREMALPSMISYPLAYSLRILPVVKRDLAEILFIRKSRRLGVFMLNPFTAGSVIMTLLSLNIERARWSGISAELRGLRWIKPRFTYRPGMVDMVFYALLIAQILYVIMN